VCAGVYEILVVCVRNISGTKISEVIRNLHPTDSLPYRNTRWHMIEYRHLNFNAGLYNLANYIL
jgi:hypothetical protein